jgi:hypothetical protein
MRIISGVAVNWQHRGDLLSHRMTCVRDIASLAWAAVRASVAGRAP